MKKTLTAIGALALGTSHAFAGGIERAPQSLNILFEPGNYVEFSLGGVDPTVKGRDLPIFGGSAIGDITQGYGFVGLAYKHQFNENLSGAILLEQPYGADILYPGSATTSALGGTRVEVNSTSLTGVLRYKFDNNFSLHGGLRASKASGHVRLSGLAYGALSGYDLELDDTWGMGWLAGVAYEVPDIAARVSLTYFSKVDHDFDMSESGVPWHPGLPGNSKNEVSTPRSIVLEGQTGIAKDTLLFGSVRWVEWSEFKVENIVFPFTNPMVPGALPVELVELEDTTTYTLGVGRKFNDNWSGSVSYTYEPSKGDVISPLSPINGRKAITVAGVYTRDNMKITTGISYMKLGKSDLGTGNPRTPRAEVTDADAWGIGVRVGYSF